MVNYLVTDLRSSVCKNAHCMPRDSVSEYVAHSHARVRIHVELGLCVLTDNTPHLRVVCPQHVEALQTLRSTRNDVIELCGKHDLRKVFR